MRVFSGNKNHIANTVAKTVTYPRIRLSDHPQTAVLMWLPLVGMEQTSNRPIIVIQNISEKEITSLSFILISLTSDF